MAEEKRLTVRLMKQWESTRGQHDIPAFKDFDTAEIQDMQPYCFVVHIEDRKQKILKCERMGERIVEVCGRDLTGKTVDRQTEKFPDAVIFNNLDIVCDELAPVEGMGQFAGINGAMVKWRACFMPFGNAKNEPSHVMVGFSFKQG